MPSPYGFAYAADAISRAISDSFKGLNEGQEERRKEEEAGRRVRAEIADQAYQPIRFKAGQLANEATQQGMDLATAQEGRASAQFPLQQRNLQATTTTNEAQAAHAYESARLGVAQAQRNLEQTDLTIEHARRVAPYTVPELERKKKTEELEYEKAQVLFDKYKTTQAQSGQANAELLAAGMDPLKILGVLSKYPDNFNVPNNAYLSYLNNYFDMLGRKDPNAVNPIQQFTAQQTAYQRAQNDAEQFSKNFIAGLVARGKVLAGGDAGLQLVRDWSEQYARARRLMQIEADPRAKALGIQFRPEDKVISPMPQALLETLAGPKPWSDITGAISGLSAEHQHLQDLAYRMNYYTQQGVDWTQAEQLSQTDRAKHLNNETTLSDYTLDPNSGQVFYGIKAGANTPAGVAPSKETPLPPAAQTPEVESRLSDPRNAKNYITGQLYPGMSWESLEGSAESQAHVESIFRKAMEYQIKHRIPWEEAVRNAAVDVSREYQRKLDAAKQPK